MSIDPNAVKLKDLVRLARPVELPNGLTAKVQPMSFRMRTLWREALAAPDGPEQDAKVLAVVRLAVPTLSDAQLQELTFEEAVAIVGIAGGELEALLASVTPVASPADGADGADGAVAEGNAPVPPDPAAAGEPGEAPEGTRRGSRRRSEPTTTSSTD